MPAIWEKKNGPPEIADLSEQLDGALKTFVEAGTPADPRKLLAAINIYDELLIKWTEVVSIERAESEAGSL